MPVVPNLGAPYHAQNLVSIVYKNGAYWVYHEKSLLNPDGGLNDK